MERDWIVVMSQYATNTQTHAFIESTVTIDSSKKWLSDTNVAMKQIDLGCKVIAPAVWGFLIALVDNRENANGNEFRYAALAVGAINVLALIVEYYCTAQIYHAIPSLAQRKSNEDESTDKLTANQEESDLPIGPAGRTTFCTRVLPQGLQTYIQQKTSFAGIGLAML